MTTDIIPMDSIDALIAKRLPSWMRGTSIDKLQGLHRALQQQQTSAHRLYQLTESIATLQAFARPLLEKAMLDRFAVVVDVLECTVQSVRWIRGPSKAASLPSPYDTQTTKQSLLAAALLNFTVDEARQDTFGVSTLRDASDQLMDVDFEQFALLCRELDLGGKYQRVLGARLRPQHSDGTSDERACRAVQALFEESLRAQLDVATRLAAIKGEIGPLTYQQMLPVVARRPIVPGDTAILTPRQLLLLGKPVCGVMVFEVREGPVDGPIANLIVWIPDAPESALQLHNGWSTLYLALGLRLRDADYREFFMRFIGERDRASFVATLDRLIASTDASVAVELDGRHLAIEPPLFKHLRQQRIDRIFDDARVLAVPTADENLKTQRERQDAYLNAGLSLLGIAGFFVPGLGQVMLAVTAGQIVDEVYEGYQDWQLGDRQAALGHLFGVAENVITTATFAAASAVAGRALERSRFVDDLRPIRTADGRFKLCADDLSSYQIQDNELALGQRCKVADQMRLRVHDATYQVIADGSSDSLRIVHPQRSTAYAPLLKHNGAGGWRHAMERPHHWIGAEHMLRRLGRRFSDLSDEGARGVLESTGFDAARLRRLHVEDAPPPARLLDAAQRYELHEQFPTLRDGAFEEIFVSRQVALGDAERVLQRNFTGLTARGAQEIAELASGDQIEHMLASNRVPLGLAEHARWFSRDSRLDRACAGLRQASAVTADTERLAIGLIEEMAPWPLTVRVELREGSPQGPLRVKTGSRNAGQVVCIYRGLRGYCTLTANGFTHPSSSTVDGLMSALFLCLGDEQKVLLGDTALETSGLVDVLARKACSDRELAAQLIGLAPTQAWLRPPVRWGDGRLGYPLSGRGESSGQAIRRSIREVFPSLSDVAMESYLLDLSTQGVDVWAHANQLHDQLDMLRDSLQQWQSQHTGVFDRMRRQRVVNALRRCWRRQAPEHPQGGFALTINGERVGSLPQLPTGLDFAHVTHVTLRNMSLAELAPDFLVRFQNAVELNLRDNRLGSIPSGIEHLGQLRRLRLDHNQIVMDAEGNRRLSALTHLRRLDLGHNPLGQAPDLHSLVRLRELSLRSTGLSELPVGAQNLPWGGITDLRDNRLRHLRQDINILRLRLEGMVLHDNPLTETDASLSEHTPGTSESGSGSSSSQQSSRSGTSGSGSATSFSHRSLDEIACDEWLADSADELRRERELHWLRLRDIPRSDDFFRFLADFANSSDFRSHPLYYRARIWRIIEACAHNEELCDLLFTQVSGPRTCQDRLLLTLSHLETSLYVATVTAGIPLAQQEERLIRVGRSLFRLDEVDRAASRHLETMRSQNRPNIDDVEVYLTYRVRLAGVLGLPAQPGSLHYESYSGVRAVDINNVRLAVLRAETQQNLCESLAGRGFWQEYLHNRYPERFDAMLSPFHRRLASAEQASLQSQEQAYVEQSNRLMQEMRATERALYLTLTQEAYARSST